MSIVFRGSMSKAYVEIEPLTQDCVRVCLFLQGTGWIEFAEVTLKDGFVLPSPLGCECLVTDISDRQWGLVNYEVSFASSYSGDGTFYAKRATRTAFP